MWVQETVINTRLKKNVVIVSLYPSVYVGMIHMSGTAVDKHCGWGGRETCIQNFSWSTSERAHLGDPMIVSVYAY